MFYKLTHDVFKFTAATAEEDTLILTSGITFKVTTLLLANSPTHSNYLLMVLIIHYIK